MGYEEYREKEKRERNVEIKKWVKRGILGICGLAAFFYGCDKLNDWQLRQHEKERRVANIIERIEGAPMFPYHNPEAIPILNCAAFEGIDSEDDPKIIEAYFKRVRDGNRLNEEYFDAATGKWEKLTGSFLPKGEMNLPDVDGRSGVGCK